MKIIDIEEFDNLDRDLVAKLSKNNEWSYSNYEGYKISTTEKDIYILVTNESCCCESWGHISSEDDLKKYIGSEVFGYNCVDNAVYNDHNGYYGHDIRIFEV